MQPDQNARVMYRFPAAWRNFKGMKFASVVVLVLFFILFAVSPANAQCAMCTKTAMDAMKDGSTASLGLNNAILYLLSVPYTLVLTIGGLWYWRHRKMARIAE